LSSDGSELLTSEHPTVIAACNKLGWPGLRAVQKEVVNPMLAGKNIVAVLPTSAGKCLGRGTPVLRHDGSVALVEDVAVGDLLMGPDSQPRAVLALSRGVGELYRVTPMRGGDPYVVNEHHVLSLKKTPQKKNPEYASQRGGTIVNVGIDAWRESSKWFRHIHKGWKTGVEFDGVELDPDLDPYLLGLWLGDGACRDQRITTMDPEIEDYIRSYANERKLGVSVEVRADNGAASTYRVIGIAGRWEHCGSPLTKALRRAGVIDNKHIPRDYLVNDRAARLELLAGLIDSDGHVEDGRHSIDFVFINERLTEDLLFLCRSLGFSATMRACEKTCTNNGVTGNYFRLYVSGDISSIPVRIERKKAAYSRRPMRTDPLRSAISVEPIGSGEYFGFELDGDHLFLLGDFTVTHNSGIYQVPALARDGMVIVVSPLIALMMDQVDTLLEKGVKVGAMHSMLSDVQKRRYFEQAKAGELDILYLSPERMLRMDARTFKGVKIQLLALDEAHCLSEWGYDFRPAYMKLGRMIRAFEVEQVIALTATATKQVAKDIADVLGISDGCERMRYSPDRPNISYMVVGKDVPLDVLVRRTGLPCLVYGGTRAGVEMGASQLKSLGYSVMPYHAGLKKHIRMETQQRFLSGDLDLIVATNAFGMGIDHSGIRGVIHMEMPSSLEAYTQEAGRAGRDGSPALAVCKATVDTLEISRKMVSVTWPSPRDVRRVWELLQTRFDAGIPRYGMAGQIDMTIKDLAKELGEHPNYLGSCLRILSDCGAIRRLSYQQRPVEIRLRAGHREIRSQRLRDAMVSLWEHATPSGKVIAPVAWLSSELGVTKQIATRLRTANAIGFDWVTRCQVMERVADGDPGIDVDMIRSIHERSLRRIALAHRYLSTSECRRDYLLRYFGDLSGGRSLGICCDRCYVNEGGTPPAQVDEEEDDHVRTAITYLTNRGIEPDPDLMEDLSSDWVERFWVDLQGFVSSLSDEVIKNIAPPEKRMAVTISRHGRPKVPWLMASGLFAARVVGALSPSSICCEEGGVLDLLSAIVVFGSGRRLSEAVIGPKLRERCVDALDADVLALAEIQMMEMAVNEDAVGVKLVDTALEILLEEREDG